MISESFYDQREKRECTLYKDQLQRIRTWILVFLNHVNVPNKQKPDGEDNEVSMTEDSLVPYVIDEVLLWNEGRFTRD